MSVHPSKNNHFCALEHRHPMTAPGRAVLPKNVGGDPGKIYQVENMNFVMKCAAAISHHLIVDSAVNYEVPRFFVKKHGVLAPRLGRFSKLFDWVSNSFGHVD